MKNRLNKLDILIDLAVVFISVTAAFLLNAWRESHNDRVSENKYLNSIYHEVVKDSVDLEKFILENTDKLRRLDSIIVRLQNGGLVIDSTAGILADMLSNITIHPRSSTYESLKSSGGLGLIEDYTLREMIVRYYESFDESKLQEQISLNFVYDYIVKFTFEEFDILNETFIKKQGIEPRRLKNLIVGYRVFLVQNVQNQKDIFTANQELLGALKKYRQ